MTRQEALSEASKLRIASSGQSVLTSVENIAPDSLNGWIVRYGPLAFGAYGSVTNSLQAGLMADSIVKRS